MKTTDSCKTFTKIRWMKIRIWKAQPCRPRFSSCACCLSPPTAPQECPTLLHTPLFPIIRFLPYDAAEKKSKLLDDMQRLFDSETTEWMLREMAENRDKAKVRPAEWGGRWIMIIQMERESGGGGTW